MQARKVNPSNFLEKNSYTNSQFWEWQEKNRRISGTLKAKLETLLPGKPTVKGSTEQLKAFRMYKNGIYEAARLYAMLNGVIGKWVGLEAAFTAEVAIIMNGFIHGKLVNCENNKNQTNITGLREYHKKINIFDNLSIDLKEENILKFLEETTDKFAFINLDFMQGMNEKLMDKILSGVENAGADKCMLLIWSCAARQCGTIYDYKWSTRPMIQTKVMQSKFDINDYHNDEYIDHVVPIMVEIFVLERRGMVPNLSLIGQMA